MAGMHSSASAKLLFLNIFLPASELLKKVHVYISIPIQVISQPQNSQR